MRQFELATRILTPPDRVFGLSLNVDAHTASMARSHEQAVGGTAQGQLRLGDEVRWHARHFGVPLTLTARITAWDPPHSFVDEQVRGPFALWRHEHRFEPDGLGGTVMRDFVEFAAPLGLLGRLAEFAVLRRYMPRLISARNSYLKKMAESEDYEPPME